MKNLLLILSFSVSFFSCENEKKETKPLSEETSTVMKLKINNLTEYNQLEEVVVGRWVRGTFNTPSIDTSLKIHFPYIPEAAFQYMQKSEDQIQLSLMSWLPHNVIHVIQLLQLETK